ARRGSAGSHGVAGLCRIGSRPSSRAATTSRRCRVLSTPPSKASRPDRQRASASGARESELLEGFATRRDAELAKEALYVRADGVLGDEQPLGDLVRAVVLVEQEQHLEL